VLQLEENIKNKKESIVSRVQEETICEEAASQDNLSQREKEIIRCVVKGLSNKEIAEELFISIHTVITHRRNIARKLEIHSPTLLTVYAIVNKLVDIGEVKIGL
jgi:DNA-binding NarL/FixJ family response regulator